MKKGWLLTVNDLKVNDTASKLCFSTEDQISQKVEKLRAKGGMRVQVYGNTPYVEVVTEVRTQIKVAGSEINPKQILRMLGKLNPIILARSETSIHMELDSFTDAMRLAVLESMDSDFSIEILE